MSALHSFVVGCLPIVLAVIVQTFRVWLKARAEQKALQLLAPVPLIPSQQPAPVPWAVPAPEPAPQDPPAPAPAPEDKDTEAPAPGVRGRLSHLLASLRPRRAPTGTEALYDVPHCVMVGTPDADTGTLLKSVELHLPFGKPEPTRDATRSTAWLFDEGKVIDLPGLTKSSEPAFLAALKELREARPLRPIDGVVLALPAALLLGTDRAAQGKARAQADAVAKGLRALQQELGVCFPVYVLFTRSEAIPGFASFCRALPPHVWNELFGWSTPHPVETAWRAEWVTEALEQIHGTLCRVQLELLASEQGQHEQERDAAFTFPSALRGLAEPARALLDPIFRPSVYQEALPLRGVYFSGDLSAGERLTARKVGTPAPAPHPIFVTQLFDEKVFPESRLARPSASLQGRNRRTRRALQWALAVSLVLMPVSLWTLEQSLRTDVKPLSDGLARLARLSMENAQARADQRPWDTEAARRRAAEAVQELAKLPGNTPAALTGRLQDALRVTFEDLVLPAFHRELGERRQRILDGEVQQPDVPAGPLAPEEAPEFQAMRSLDQELATFTAQVDAFNGLGGQSGLKRLETVDGLARYLLRADPGTAFLQNGALYEDALARASAPRFEEPLAEAAPRRAHALARKLSRRLFLENPLEVDLKTCVDLAARLEAGGDTNESAAHTARQLAQSLESVRKELVRPGVTWLSAPALGKPFTELLDSLRKSRALGEPVAADLERGWTGELGALRERLCGLSSRSTGPLLARDGQGCKLELSESALALEKALKDLLARGFMAEPEAPPPPPPAGPVRVFWSEAALDEALNQTALYEGFLAEGLGTFPGELREVVADVAGQQLERRLRIQVARARKVERAPEGEAATRSPQAEALLAAELANLKQVDGKLRHLRDISDRLLLTTASHELGGLLVAQAGSLLERVDALFERAALYTPDARFSRWQGTRPAALEAFAVPDAASLLQYLKAQRTRATELARDFAALPVSLQWGVTTNGDRPPLLLKWRRIVDELRDHEQQVPGNSVRTLESFIQTDMMDVTSGNCLQRLPAAGGEGTDFFLARRASLRDQVAHRCEQLATGQLGEDYARLALHFNTSLAGRFPFTSDVVESSDAALPELRALYQELDALLPWVEASRFSERPAASQPLSAEAYAFLDQLNDTLAFLAPLLQDEDAAVVGYGLRMEPRVNRGGERFANQIISWRMEAGGRPVGGVKPGVWHLGEPLQVALRWAKDAPYAPINQGQPCGGGLEPDATARFEFTGTWALLRLLRAHQGRPADFGGGADTQPHTLRFAIRIEEKKSHLCEQAVAFLRVALTSPDGKARLLAPRVWPARAPSGQPGSNVSQTRTSTP